jgi:hypothetical protein
MKLLMIEITKNRADIVLKFTFFLGFSKLTPNVPISVIVKNKKLPTARISLFKPS